MLSNDSLAQILLNNSFNPSLAFSVGVAGARSSTWFEPGVVLLEAFFLGLAFAALIFLFIASIRLAFFLSTFFGI